MESCCEGERKNQELNSKKSYKSNWYWLCFEKEVPTWIPYDYIYNKIINEYYQQLSTSKKITPLRLLIDNKAYEITLDYNNDQSEHVVPLGTKGTQINIDSDDPMIRPIIHDIPNENNKIGDWIVSTEKKKLLQRFLTNIFSTNNQSDKIDNGKKQLLLESSPYIIGRQCNGHCGNSISYMRYCFDIVMHDIDNNLEIPVFELYRKYRGDLFCPSDANSYLVIFKAMSNVFWESIVLFYDCLSSKQKEYLIDYITFFCLIYKYNCNSYDVFSMKLVNMIKNQDTMIKCLHIINQCEDIKQINKTKKLIYQMQTNRYETQNKSEDEIEQKVKQYCIDFYKSKLKDYHRKLFNTLELLIVASQTFTFNIDFPCLTSIQNFSNVDIEIKRNKFESVLNGSLYQKIDTLYNCEKHQKMKYPLNREEIKVIYLYCEQGKLCSDIRDSHYREHQACKWYTFSKILYRALLKLMKSDTNILNIIKQQQYLYHGLSNLDYDHISKDKSFKKFGANDVIRMGTFVSTAIDKTVAEFYGSHEGFLMHISTKNFEQFYDDAKSINIDNDNVFLPYITCFADIGWISCFDDETEILLSPFYMKCTSSIAGNIKGEIESVKDIIRNKGNSFFNINESKNVIDDKK